jgi:hypothetical protein
MKNDYLFTKNLLNTKSYRPGLDEIKDVVAIIHQNKRGCSITRQPLLC